MDPNQSQNPIPNPSPETSNHKIFQITIIFILFMILILSNTYWYISSRSIKKETVSTIEVLKASGEQKDERIVLLEEEITKLRKPNSDTMSFTERQFAAARNTQRKSDITAILNAIHQYAADPNNNDGSFPSGITSDELEISSHGADICSALVPEYLAMIPVDPSITNAPKNCNEEYSSGYYVQTDNTGTRVEVTSRNAELNEVISILR